MILEDVDENGEFAENVLLEDLETNCDGGFTLEQQQEAKTT